MVNKSVCSSGVIKQIFNQTQCTLWMMAPYILQILGMKLNLILLLMKTVTFPVTSYGFLQSVHWSSHSMCDLNYERNISTATYPFWAVQYDMIDQNILKAMITFQIWHFVTLISHFLNLKFSLRLRRLDIDLSIITNHHHLVFVVWLSFRSNIKQKHIYYIYILFKDILFIHKYLIAYFYIKSEICDIQFRYR